jgi:hypothetical protein
MLVFSRMDKLNLRLAMFNCYLKFKQTLQDTGPPLAYRESHRRGRLLCANSMLVPSVRLGHGHWSSPSRRRPLSLVRLRRDPAHRRFCRLGKNHGDRRNHRCRLPSSLPEERRYVCRGWRDENRRLCVRLVAYSFLTTGFLSFI